MAIPIQENTRTSTPVLRQARIGEVAYLAIIRPEQRNRLIKNQATGEMEPIQNGTDSSGMPKYKQELVIHGIALPGTTMEAKIGDNSGVPNAGDRVRLILKGRGFADYIEARRGHRRGQLNVGDVLKLETTFAQAYDQSGKPKNPKITSQAEADKLPRSVTVGFYGPLSLHEPEDEDQCITAAAEEAYSSEQ